MPIEKLSDNEIKLLNTIRRFPHFSKSELSVELGIPWSTVSNAIKKLQEKNLLNDIIDEDENSSIYAKQYGAHITVNSSYEFYIGISVGTSNIKLIILDFAFNVVKKSFFDNKPYYKNFQSFCNLIENNLNFNQDLETEYCEWCSITPDDTTELRIIIKDTTEYINNLKSDTLQYNTDCFNIAAICFTFPGLVDYKSQKIIDTTNSGNVGFLQCDVSSIISSTVNEKLQKNNIKVFVDHNVKSCTVAEQEALFIKQGKYSDRNIIVLYLGKGIGIGMVLDRKLYRGNNNRAGQFGRRLINYKNTLDEYKDHIPLEEAIRKDVFHHEDDFTKINAKKLRVMLTTKEYEKERILLVNILSDSLGNVIKDLGVEHIIFSGKFNQIFREIENDLRTKFEYNKQYNLILEGSSYGEYPAAVGAAMSCFNNIYSIPFEWDY